MLRLGNRRYRRTVVGCAIYIRVAGVAARAERRAAPQLNQSGVRYSAVP